VVLGIGAGFWINNSKSQADHDKSGPQFQAVLPANKNISDLGGWQRISPEGKAPVFAYNDEIDGISINVSQQPLPDSFKDDVTGKIAELAKAYNATDTFDADGTKVFIGSSSLGPQSVIFTKNNLLILIKSKEKISDLSWTNYVKSLTGKYSSDNYKGATY
jgi:hypothetical protein